MSRTYADEAIAEAQRLIEESTELGRTVRLRCKRGVWTFVVEGKTHEGFAIEWVGRGRSIHAAMEWLGAWEAF